MLTLSPADTHNLTSHDLRIPPGDVLIHAGDFSNVGLPEDVQRFRDFLETQPHPTKVNPVQYCVDSVHSKSCPVHFVPV